MSEASGSGRTPIDVLIPAIDKDLETLPFVIDGLRRHVKHPIGSIYIVSPDSPRIKKLCKVKKCKFVHENSVLPLTKKDIRYRSKRWDRSGWLYQQLLKLNGDKICGNRYFLVTDADTVLIRPHRFLENGKQVFFTRNWSHTEYFRIHAKLLGQKATSRPSYVNHYMLYDKVKLSRLKKAISARHKMPWYRAILKNLNTAKQFGFSEFETYGNFVHARYPGTSLLKPARNKEFKKSIRFVPHSEREKWAGKFRSLSFHKRGGYYFKAKKTK
ncbi:DUF6492 family protein [Paenibacillus sp. 1P03SA]|uniref:DUF6492 family protein n=1 Tax=Paenibacillus sp. 1P03SA TaxID=3132294 RepID=UPI0039A10899